MILLGSQSKADGHFEVSIQKLFKLSHNRFVLGVLTQRISSVPCARDVIAFERDVSLKLIEMTAEVDIRVSAIVWRQSLNIFFIFVEYVIIMICWEVRVVADRDV